jgi:hypothetical protein
VGVSKVFGPTYPGNELRYPGLWFSFHEDGRGEGLKVPHAGDRMQEVKRIVISQIDPEGKTHDALDEVTECAAMAGDLARAVVKASLRINFNLTILTNYRSTMGQHCTSTPSPLRSPCTSESETPLHKI